jgi:hypothetical protein
MIDPSTNLLELIVVLDKEAAPWLVPSTAPGSVATQDPSSVFMIREPNSLVLSSKNSSNPTVSKQ